MATLKFDGTSYAVDHAVKGADYVHGYSADGLILISIEGIDDFSVVEYDGEYLTPDACADELCNTVLYCNSKLKTKGGTDVSMHATATASLAAGGWSSKKQTVSVPGVTANNTIIVVAAPASHTAYYEANVRCVAQSAGQLTFECDSVPTTLIANVLILL